MSAENSAASPSSTSASLAARWFVPGDLDGFFGLFFSGFPDLLLIAGLAPLCGFPTELVAGRILPAVALSILGGNLFYAWQAHRLAQRTNRADVTAIPFGVNTPTIFAYVFLIMLPAYQRTGDGQLAWHLGVFACFLSGIVQTAGAFCTDWLRRHTPRAALLCPLAGIAIAFLCLGFILRIFQTPELALLPTVIILAVYGSRIRLPFRIPGGLLCILAGVILVVVLRALNLYHLPSPPALIALGIHFPQPVNIFEFLRHGEGWGYLSIILPMSALDTIVSLQILESVKVAGDDYATRPSLLVNGLATLAAAAFGSPFPTTLYFGHLAHKAYGARIGYSILNGVATFLICITGLISPILHFVPLEVVAIVHRMVWPGHGGAGLSGGSEIALHSGCVRVASDAGLVGTATGRFGPAERGIEPAAIRPEVWRGARDLWTDCAQPGSAAGFHGVGSGDRVHARPALSSRGGMVTGRSRAFVFRGHPRLRFECGGNCEQAGNLCRSGICS